MGSADVAKWEQLMQTRLERSNKGEVKRFRAEAAKGLSPEARMKVYPWLLRPEVKVDNYSLLSTKQIQDETLAHTIEADSTRTLPRAKSELISSKTLRSVLTAYANYRPQIGYTQGMSNLAAVILKHCTSEEEAFQSFVHFMSLFRFQEVFKPGFELLFRWMKMFEALVSLQLPTVKKKLNQKGITSELYVDKWFLTGMTYNFPEVTCLRLWDMMLIDGNEKVLFRAGIAILALGEEKGVYDGDYEDAVKWLQRGFAEERELLDNGGSRFVQRTTNVLYKRSTLADAVDGHHRKRSLLGACLS
mmetsp:Transcript_13184/g.40549  ORF Transcript_13184/g.40549 Transcript_13184/m.40549 type:complete len:303 (+) Transcript_13184:210-1118(+)